jgi:antitoxin ChpS
MPYDVQLRKVGGSVMLAIPKPMLDALDLSPEASVGLSIKGGKLVVDP